MTMKPYILEMGTGIDLHGQDYTKAAKRAVEDAIHRNSLLFVRALGIESYDRLNVDVTVGVPRPESVNKQEVLAVLPVGQGRITLVRGGLEVSPWEDSSDKVVVANCAVVVSLDVD